MIMRVALGIHKPNISAALDTQQIHSRHEWVFEWDHPYVTRLYDTAQYVDQGGGKRIGSFAIYLELWHADVLELLQLRKNHGNELHPNGDWSFFCPNEAPGLFECWVDEFKKLYEQYEKDGQSRKTLKAQQLWAFEKRVTPLVGAARRGHVAVVLLERCETGCGDDDYGYTALHYEVKHGHLTVVNSLLLNGAKLDAICTEHHSSPLHLAAKSGHGDVLMACKLKHRHKTVCGPYTLPHTVATRASSNFCWITERNWKRRTSGSNKTTPLLGAVSKGRTDVVELLLAHGADTNAVLPTHGTTALHSAVANGFVDILKMLTATGVDPNRKLDVLSHASKLDL
ncbi:hypothetical protein PsorP6_007351 [Peronosclerospora sorghi]|uniref:Uncharacterized protein n=1 Tax=Peronosclerospora sorghi TaxID=230839 RepID=A0ACC0W6Y8_9STRA|nr:hypothetical protein PsorP6_007351 [Peronosclerospora sorghi]